MKGPHIVEHYCQGRWVIGERADCPEVVHNVKLRREVRPT